MPANKEEAARKREAIKNELLNGSTYAEISEKLHASPKLIAEVNKSLKIGTTSEEFQPTALKTTPEIPILTEQPEEFDHPPEMEYPDFDEYDQAILDQRLMDDTKLYNQACVITRLRVLRDRLDRYKMNAKKGLVDEIDKIINYFEHLIFDIER